MSDIANLTPEESFKVGLPLVLALEARIAREQELSRTAEMHEMRMVHRSRISAYRDALALVTAKDADQ